MDKLPQREVHLDFHTSEDVDGIGSHFNKEQFVDCLKKGHVNSITVFAKCHHGWAYFPSKANKMHPGLKFDLLSEMLSACKSAGVSAPVYISAGFDQKYAVEHPDHLHHWDKDWKPCEVAEKNGKKYFVRENVIYDLICMNSPYLDSLKAQTIEVVEKFMPVGLFFDIVAPRPCYCKYCTEKMVSLGLNPDSDQDRMKMGEITYKHYYDTVNNAARSIKPDIRLFHNGGHIACGKREMAYANTHLELESLPTGGWGYDHFPMSAKYVNCLGLEYLGMTGKFHLSWGEFGGYKHPNALRYEVALSLANGAKISIGDQMHPYGFLDDATYELIGGAFEYAESVEEYTNDVKPVADIGVISVEALSNDYVKDRLPDVGASRMLLEGKYLFDILDIECDFSKYKLIILPDIIEVSESLKEKLDAFVNSGGKLLCSGASGTRDGKFLYDFGVEFCGKSEFKPSYCKTLFKPMGLSDTSYIMYSDKYDTKLSDNNAKVFAYSRDTFFNRKDEHFCSHYHTPYLLEDSAPGVVLGKDGGYIAWKVFTDYAEYGSHILRDLVEKLIEEILSDNKTLKTNLPSLGVVTLNEQEHLDRTILHVLYAVPTKRGKAVEIIEDVLPVYNTTFEIKTKKEIKKVVLVPQNKEIPFEYKNGACTFTLDEFTCSQIIKLVH